MNKLIANEKAYQTLAAYLDGGRLSHALLIEAPPGCGKSTFAMEIAQAALCSAGDELPLLGGLGEPADAPQDKPCGVCRDCVKVEKGIHPDVLIYGGEGGSRSFHVDTVRALRQQAYVRPNEAEGKVIVLRNTQEMSTQAQNALLKIIEEPPAGVTFLLTCTNRWALLETIRSRVQVIQLAVPTTAQCAAALAELLPEKPPEERETAAARAGGSIGRALALLAEDGAPQEPDKAVEILCNACIGDELAAMEALARYERDRQGLGVLMEKLAATLSEALLHPPEQGPLAQLVKRAGTLRLLQILAIIEDTARAAEQNAGGLLLVTSVTARIRAVMAGG